MPEDVDCVVDVEYSAQTPVNPAKLLLSSRRKSEAQETDLGPFRGMMFALPAAILLWVLIGVLVYIL